MKFSSSYNWQCPVVRRGNAYARQKGSCSSGVSTSSQLAAGSCLQAVILGGDIHPPRCLLGGQHRIWKETQDAPGLHRWWVLVEINTRRTEQAQGLTEQVTSREELVAALITQGSPGCSSHKMMEVDVQRKGGRWAEDPRLLGSKQRLVEGLPGMIPWGADIKGKGAQESWQVSKGNLLRAQQWTILSCGKTGNFRRRSAWLDGELLIELAHKRGVEKR